MPALTLVLPRTEQSSTSDSPVARIARVRIPAWAALVALLVVGATAFAYGRHKPAHHYVSYFGYPMVLDTTTGKACYATKPRTAEPKTLEDAAFPPNYDGADRPETYIPNGPSVPLCGQD
ncbi:hypothetical protein DYQ86_20915 [Acidobacteria bacterium AB60]|nr:hypothetical protein DYQ86_20915 [Acidobacteria bacterium AB60]